MKARLSWRTTAAVVLSACAAGCIAEQPDQNAWADTSGHFVVEDVVVFLPQETPGDGEAEATSDKGIAVEKLIIRQNDFILIREGGRGQLHRFNPHDLNFLRWEKRDVR